MASRDFLFTSESVTEGHPDKVADQISDAILDDCIGQDPHARVACETLVNTGLAIIAGEITTTAYVDMPKVVRNTVREIGYVNSDIGFDANTCAVLTSIDQQASDIAQGVDEDDGLHKEQGAGDQGLMFGYACSETPELMPLPIQTAHRLAQRLAAVRRAGEVDFLRPDGKTQVTVEYVDGQPKRIDAIVVSTQHKDTASWDQVREAVLETVIKPIVPAEMLDDKTTFYVNPTGRFVMGGPLADCGLTGRKIIVDTYGGMAPHGGGAFSGKDPTKVDRSAAYYARYCAKNVVAAGLASRVQLQVAYAIGVAKPVGIHIETFGTETVDLSKLLRGVKEVFDFRPKAMIDQLRLRRPIFKATAAYGHFGRSGDGFTWEQTDRAEALKASV